MRHTDLPVRDPSPHLSPTARRILDAALRVLDQHGFSGLTFERIAGEASENGALIRYHFGSKAGLISALVDTVLFAEARGVMASLARSQPGRERRQALFREHYQLTQSPTTFRRFYELIPSMMRDPELRERLSEFLRWYRNFDGWAIAGERTGEQGDEVARLGLLAVAMLNGLALHAQADPDLDVESAFQLWAKLVAEHLEGREGS